LRDFILHHDKDLKKEEEEEEEEDHQDITKTSSEIFCYTNANIRQRSSTQKQIEILTRQMQSRPGKST
jgi:hypothetical protein